MTAAKPEDPTAPLPLPERIALAQQLFRENYIRCFWHLRPDLVVTEADLPIVIQGLQSYGGRQQYLDAARLIADELSCR